MSETTKNRPNWIREAGSIAITLPPPPLVQKYRGAQALDAEAQYAAFLSDAALEGYARAGVSLIHIHFYNGFGIEYEKTEVERVREVMARASARGIKTGARIEAGTLTLETLLLEEGDAHNWLQVNSLGLHVKPESGDDAFRLRPCYNSEAFMRYMERVCGMAADAGADLISVEHFDYNAEPDTCRCPICVGLFREFLRHQYGIQEERTREAGRERFGHNSFTHVRPPGRSVEESDCADTPHEQEWIRFKDVGLAQCLARLSRGVSKRKPQCAVAADLFNRPYMPEGDLFGQLSAHVDIAGIQPYENPFESENPTAGNPPVGLSVGGGDDPRAAYQAQDEAELGGVEGPESSDSPDAPHFALGSAYYSYILASKAARSAGLIVEGVVDDSPVEPALALRVAFNPSGVLRLDENLVDWFAPGRAETNEDLKIIAQYQEFATLNRDLLLGARSLATVAVLRDAASLGYDPAASAAQSRFENMLIDLNIPFELLFSHELRDLERYRCVVLANCECLSNGIAKQLEKFVESGGGLLAMGEAGCRDEWRRMRPRTVFSSLFGADYPEPVKRDAGSGRVVYLPLHDSGGANNLIESLEFAAGGAMPFNAEPESGRVTVEACRTTAGAIIVHAVNPDEDPVHGLQIEVMCDQAPKQIIPLSPLKKYEPLAVDWEEGSALIELEELERYVMFKLDFV